MIGSDRSPSLLLGVPDRSCRSGREACSHLSLLKQRMRRRVHLLFFCFNTQNRPDRTPLPKAYKYVF